MKRSAESHRVGIALGSNLGSRIGNLREARKRLWALSDNAASCLQAPVYQSAPVGCPDDSPDFFNTVVEISFAGSPEELLRLTQAIEFQLGRQQSEVRNAPRVIDVDILYFGDEIVRSDELELPHPRMTDRLFVLQPLAEICPQLILPRDQVTILEHLEHLDSGEEPLGLVQTNW
ncbi:2-amino-4-hydroxy-6-hydroxymethyldihydropteridine diphosphokinase [Persicirhabdus sediminis]|uniref:2-amino-4-hydroxy-6-hydroxymethyldihydropteridine pyrophosphokinase n=1 Tax=Persicirhabdus sediminis TaxID=454144 RepID=A0A8J7MG03_9BACT|nr:2-amino-4-hydroxy-6-hydroxymethyldihydropteridine diphosphokinase [Persicirhabdus sediminis]MBK1791119.1 2-amino-4-hydroxy-6-hydroxymethyldihydropteridine diphosphokinase [Persicirhabdus sediminis]